MTTKEIYIQLEILKKNKDKYGLEEYLNRLDVLHAEVRKNLRPKFEATKEESANLKAALGIG